MKASIRRGIFLGEFSYIQIVNQENKLIANSRELREKPEEEKITKRKSENSLSYMGITMNLVERSCDYNARVLGSPSPFLDGEGESLILA